MFRLSLISFTALSLVAVNVPSVQAQGDVAAGIIGGILGGIIGNAGRQAPPPAYPTYAPQPQGYVVRPDPQVQQQIDAERQRASGDAAERAQQRKQAEVDAKAKAQAGVLKAQAAAQVAAKAKADAEERERQASAKALAEATAKLRADPALVSVLGPDPRDISVLIVAQDTANVIRNLQGDPTFQAAPKACLPFGGLATDPASQEQRFWATVKRAIEQKGAITDSRSSLVPAACDPADLGQNDVLIFSGAQVANGPPEILTVLVDALHQREFVPFGTFTVAKFQADEGTKAAASKLEKAQEQAAREEATAKFQSRDASIISAIQLEQPAAVVCLMVPNAEGVRYLLGRDDQPFGKMIGPKTVLRTLATANDVFIALKKRECTAAVAPAGALGNVITALARDGSKVEVQGGILAQDKLDNWKVLAGQDLITQQDQQAKELADRRRMDAIQKAEREQKQALENERRKHEQAAREEEMTKMRKLVSSKANAVVDGFTTLLSGHMASVHDAIAKRRQPNDDAVGVFQPWTAWYEQQVKEQWDFSPVRAIVEDYGRAQWKARTIEALAVRVEFPMTNRQIGEKKSTCFQFVWINDEEFGFRRSPISMPCESYEQGFVRWSQENNFASQWKLIEGSE